MDSYLFSLLLRSEQGNKIFTFSYHPPVSKTQLEPVLALDTKSMRRPIYVRRVQLGTKVFKSRLS